MPDEAVLREFARFGMRDGRLPRREPHRIWGRPGVGSSCAVCETATTAEQVEYVVEFTRDGPNPGLDRFLCHLRCFAMWEVERTKLARPLDGDTPTGPSPTAPEPLRFSLTGTVATWDRFGRWLWIGERSFWVDPSVSEDGLTPGARVSVVGHQEDLTARWIVTQLTRD
jgi:hypothetical protein